ncbi:uncharacterized protein LOC5521907 isoform X2 [Nematostella vectensis]|nr:uncharacterized protein LOC5521907 isoform X2 [Nematostella vectensis]
MVGCTNPYVYQLPDGTIVDMATKRIYKRPPQTTRHFNGILVKSLPPSPPPEKNPFPHSTCAVVPVIDLTKDDSDEETVDTFPKIVSAFSLASEYAPLSIKDASEILSKENDAYPGGFIDLTETSVMWSTCDVSMRSDVMGDVTNLPSCVSNNPAKVLFDKSLILGEHKRQVYSLNEKTTTDICRPRGHQAPVPEPQEKSVSKRKSKHEIRKDFSEQSPLKDGAKKESQPLEGVAIPCAGESEGTPWSFRITSPVLTSRQAKIENLKRELSKHEKTVEKLRGEKRKDVQKTSPLQKQNTIEKLRARKRSARKRTVRTLVIKIDDLKSFLPSIADGKNKFRVGLSKDGRTTADGVPLVKRRRNLQLSRHTPVNTYPSYVVFENLPKYKGKKLKSAERVKRCDSPKPSPSSSDNEDADATFNRSRKRARPAKRNRGRNVSIGREFFSVPVIPKDLWHKELEKVEETIADVSKTLNQDSFLLCLGLKKS